MVAISWKELDTTFCSTVKHKMIHQWILLKTFSIGEKVGSISLTATFTLEFRKSRFSCDQANLPKYLMKLSDRTTIARLLLSTALMMFLLM